METVRMRRLRADHEKLTELVRRHPRLRLVEARGEPPERYQIEFRVRGLRQKGDELLEVDSHLVEISLPRDYPRSAPLCRMLTPVFHPNIAPHAICIGDHWSAGEPLASIVTRIGEMIAYQSYNTKSPLNGEAAKWTDGNLARLPLDPVSMVPDEREGSPPLPSRKPRAAVEDSSPRPSPPKAKDVPAAPRPAVPPAAARGVGIQFSCPECATKIKVAEAHAGKRVRCPRCRKVVTAPKEGA